MPPYGTVDCVLSAKRHLDLSPSNQSLLLQLLSAAASREVLTTQTYQMSAKKLNPRPLERPDRWEGLGRAHCPSLIPRSSPFLAPILSKQAFTRVTAIRQGAARLSPHIPWKRRYERPRGAHRIFRICSSTTKRTVLSGACRPHVASKPCGGQKRTPPLSSLRRP